MVCAGACLCVYLCMHIHNVYVYVYVCFFFFTTAWFLKNVIESQKIKLAVAFAQSSWSFC